MGTAAASSVQLAAIAAATTIALPTVDQIFGNGSSLSQLSPSQIWDGLTPPQANQYLNQSVDNLYWQLGFWFPQFNKTGIILNGLECNIDVCSTLLGSFLYLPNLPANIFFAAFFVVMLIASVGLSIRRGTWGYMAGMLGGLVLEILGYIGRVLAHNDDFSSTPFYLYIVCLTIGPAFLSASIYLCLARIVVVYGPHLSRFAPKTYTYIFIGCDFLSLLLQAAGGGMAASFDGGSTAGKAGIDIMIAGLAWQVLSLAVFMALCADYALRIVRHRDQKDSYYASLRSSFAFRGFLVALGVATTAIFVRSIFRVAELQQGFKSPLANNEVTFMILEATMITIAVLALTLFHPTIVFGELWKDVSSNMKSRGGSKMNNGNSLPSSEFGLAEISPRY